MGISNLSRYIGGALAVAAASTVFTAVTRSHQAAGAAPAEALAIGLSRASLMLAISCAAGVLVALPMATTGRTHHDRPLSGRCGSRPHHPGPAAWLSIDGSILKAPARHPHRVTRV